MEPEAIDPAGFRDAQHRNWDSAAVGWMEWSEFNDRADRHVSERLVELAGVGRPEGRVVATDISAEMLAFGRERASAAGLGNVEFMQSDASGIDFPHESFDAAVSRWGIIFEPDAEAAAGRVRTFLRPGARIAISSWGEPDRVPFLSLPMRTTIERLGVSPPPPGTPGPLSRPTPAAIAGLLEGGGFSNVAVERDEVVFEFDSPEHFTAYVRAIAAPIRAMIERHAGDAQEESRAAVTRAAAAVSGGSTPLRLANEVLLASATA